MELPHLYPIETYPLSTEGNPEKPKCAAFQDELGNALQYHHHLRLGTGFRLPSGGLLRAGAHTQNTQPPVERKDLLAQNGGQQIRHSLILCKKIFVSPCSFLNAAKRCLKQFYSTVNLSSWAKCTRFHGKSVNSDLFEVIPQNNLPSQPIFNCISFKPPLFFY